jgi:protein gp37
MTDIEWCQNPDGTKGKTWNPVRGCSRVSAGCAECYAMKFAHRFSNEVNGKPGPYQGLTTIRKGKVDWAGFARLHPEMLSEPLTWRKPQRVFVNSMSDLFHESLTDVDIAAVFGVMAACPRHTFMILTKRPLRAAQWFKSIDAGAIDRCVCAADDAMRETARAERARWFAPGRGAASWPLPNVHLGVSCEDQDAWKRVAVLVHQCPAAVHWASCEPLLGPIKIGGTGAIHLNWLVLGSESGPGARQMDVAWARSLVDQCVENGIPVFTKQIATGANGKGGDPATWPVGNWPRQYPEVRA